MTISNNLIHNGHNTHNHDQLITPVNFNVINTIVKILHIPNKLLFFEFIFSPPFSIWNLRFVTRLSTYLHKL